VFISPNLAVNLLSKSSIFSYNYLLSALYADFKLIAFS